MAQKSIWIRQNGKKKGREGLGDPVNIHEVPDVRRRKLASEIDSRINHLPAFPTILSELIGLTSSDVSAAKDLKACIEKDPVLTARLLKLSNSAFYSPRLPVTSVQQAVVMLGQQTVKSIAMAAATMKFLGNRVSPYGMGAGGLWMHSYVVAELARMLAQKAGWMNHEQDVVYAGGLLHDIGKIVLADTLTAMNVMVPRPDENLDGENEFDIELWEEEQCGFTHTGIGKKIADKWRLADITRSCIAYHHAWTESPEEHSREVKIITLADVGATNLGIGLEYSTDPGQQAKMILEAFELDSSQFQEMLDDYSATAKSAEEMYSSLGGTR